MLLLAALALIVVHRMRAPTVWPYDDEGPSVGLLGGVAGLFASYITFVKEPAERWANLAVEISRTYLKEINLDQLNMLNELC
jgi:hypothetical protein